MYIGNGNVLNVHLIQDRSNRKGILVRAWRTLDRRENSQSSPYGIWNTKKTLQFVNSGVVTLQGRPQGPLQQLWGVRVVSC